MNAERNQLNRPDPCNPVPEVSKQRSAEIVEYLRGQGKTLKEIGRLTGLSESYVSRVGQGDRNFRVDHLVRLEETLGAPLPLLLIEATAANSLPKSLSKAYEQLKKALKRSAQLRAEFVKVRHMGT